MSSFDPSRAVGLASLKARLVFFTEDTGLNVHRSALETVLRAMGVSVDGLHRIIVALRFPSPAPKVLNGDHHRTSVLLFDALLAEPALKFHARLLPALLDKGNVRFPPVADIPRNNSTMEFQHRAIATLTRFRYVALDESRALRANGIPYSAPL